MSKFDRVLSNEDLLDVYRSIDIVRLYYGEDRQSYAGQYARAAIAAIAKAAGEAK